MLIRSLTCFLWTFCAALEDFFLLEREEVFAGQSSFIPQMHKSYTVYIIRDLCLLYHLCVHNKIFLQMYIVKKNQMILSVAYLAIKRQSLCFQSAIWTEPETSWNVYNRHWLLIVTIGYFHIPVVKYKTVRFRVKIL